jgi:nucleoside-diphosphate-sugar epimerase
MKVLITGGAGFIGSHLAERCLKAGWDVSVIDDLSTGSFENIAALQFVPRFSSAIDTVFNVPLMSELMDSADIVIHLAAAVGVRLIVESPVRSIETNVHGTSVVLRAAAEKGKRVILASTSEVYGKSTELPFRESANLVLGATTYSRWSYACSKALDEFLALAYWREMRLPVTVVRFFNTVGPRQTGRYGMVLPTLAKQALAGEPLTVFGSGEQRRCFGYVDDVVEALIRLIRADKAAGEVINIGNDAEISISALAHLVRTIARSKSEIRYIPYETAYGPGFEDMQRRVPSLEKLERLTGYRPSTPIETIVEMVVDDLQRKTVESPSVAAFAAAAS